MARILAAELLHHLNQTIEMRGWLNNIRQFGKVNFLILRDRTGFVQVVIEDKDEYRKLTHLQPGSILAVHGTAIASTQTVLGVEIIDARIDIEVPVTHAPLIEYYKPIIPTDLEFILDHRAIALRNRHLQAVFKIQAAIAHAYRLFMNDKVQAVEYFSPSLIGASSEGGAEFFNVDYFGHTATLAQSSQLYKQIMVGVNERVYALMPFFRAEPSQTSRHLTEGKQFEFEMGFFEHWHEIMDVQENCIKYIVNYLQSRYANEIALLDAKIIEAPMNVPFPRVSFARAQEIYFQRTGIDERNEPDLSPAAERELCKYAFEEFGTNLIFITDWKTAKRPFYAYPNDEQPEITNTFDLLCAGTEITSGGQRRHTYTSMLQGLAEKGMQPDEFEDYLSIFKYGMPPHGGFGMGLERLTMTLLGLKNIREASLFPSDPKRIAGKRIKAHMFFGGENVRNEIIRLLKHHQMDYQYNQTSIATMDSNEENNIKIKALILSGKQSKKNYQMNILANTKLDMKAVAALLGERCEFEDPAVIKERFGIVIGGVPPFGLLLGLEVFFDDKIQATNTVVFDGGQPGESISMQTSDLIKLVQPKFASFAKY